MSEGPSGRAGLDYGAKGIRVLAVDPGREPSA